MIESQFKMLITITSAFSLLLFGIRFIFWLQYITRFKDRVSLNFFWRYGPHDVYGTDLKYRRKFMQVFNNLTSAWWISLVLAVVLVVLKINL